MTEDAFKNEILVAFEYSFKHSDWRSKTPSPE